MTWRPLDQVPDPLQLALCDAVRAFILQHDVGRGIARDADGLLVVPVPGGADLRVGFRGNTQAPTSFGPRDGVRYELEGRAVQGRMSYGVKGHAVLDVKSKAFVEVGCTLLWQAAV